MAGSLPRAASDLQRERSDDGRVPTLHPSQVAAWLGREALPPSLTSVGSGIPMCAELQPHLPPEPSTFASVLSASSGSLLTLFSSPGARPQSNLIIFFQM